MAGACLLFVLLMLPGASASDPSPAPASAALTASASDTPDAVRLRIQASGDVEPGSVEVRFAGRKAVVLARDAEGQAIRSEKVRNLPFPYSWYDHLPTFYIQASTPPDVRSEFER